MFETMQKIAIAVLVGMAAVGAIQDWSRDVPSVTADYYTQTQTGGEIEEIYTAMGEYDVDYAEYPAQDLLIKQYKIWYPSALAGEEGREWPIVVMANGTGVPASRYAPVFRHLASWGFVVIGNEMQNSWSGGRVGRCAGPAGRAERGPVQPLLPQAGPGQRGIGGALPGGHWGHQCSDRPAQRGQLQSAVSGQHPVQPVRIHFGVGL